MPNMNNNRIKWTIKFIKIKNLCNKKNRNQTESEFDPIFFWPQLALYFLLCCFIDVYCFFLFLLFTHVEIVDCFFWGGVKITKKKEKKIGLRKKTISLYNKNQESRIENRESNINCHIKLVVSEHVYNISVFQIVVLPQLKKFCTFNSQTINIIW